MTQEELAIAVQDSTDLDLKTCRRIVAALIVSMRERLQAGDSIEVRGFGTFSPWKRKGRWVQVNNKSKRGSNEFIAPVQIKDRTSVKFRPSLYLKVMLDKDLNADHHDTN